MPRFRLNWKEDHKYSHWKHQKKDKKIQKVCISHYKSNLSLYIGNMMNGIKGQTHKRLCCQEQTLGLCVAAWPYPPIARDIWWGCCTNQYLPYTASLLYLTAANVQISPQQGKGMGRVGVSIQMPSKQLFGVCVPGGEWNTSGLGDLVRGQC